MSSPNAPNSLNDVDAPSLEQLADVVRRGLHLSATAPVSLSEIGEFSNINYVYRVDTPERSLYLKVVPERPKRFPARLPRERVYSEAEGLRRFRSLAGDAVLIPEVLFVDDQAMALAMSDVGIGRQVLFSVLPDHFELLAEQAEALGRALGAIHGGTRGAGTLRPPQEEAIIRKIIFDGLLAPGAKQAFPDLWDALNVEMQAHRQCLIHGDLWSKNLLVRRGEPVAVVDFEGVCYGDPAFDLGTLIAAALVPALDRPALLSGALAFTSELLHFWASACGSEAWCSEVLPRTFHATATFLAARAFGPFAYSLTDAGGQRIAGLARSLAAEPPATLESFQAEVVRLPQAT
jgi:aminoglycoside phosphotransferase (APT) family kinase protein